MLAAPVLYRSALSALSVARATSLDQGLIDYLETSAPALLLRLRRARDAAGTTAGGFFRQRVAGR
jgi:hypothetical protein